MGCKGVGRRISSASCRQSTDDPITLETLSDSRIRRRVAREGALSIRGDRSVGERRGSSPFEGKTSSQKRTRKVSLDCGLKGCEQRTYGKAFQNGNAFTRAPIYSNQSMGNNPRSQGGLLPRVSGRTISPFSGNLSSRWLFQALQNPKFRVISSSMDFYKDYSSGVGDDEKKRNMLLSLSRRLYRPWGLRGGSKRRASQCGEAALCGPWFNNQPREGTFNTNTMSGLPRCLPEFRRRPHKHTIAQSDRYSKGDLHNNKGISYGEGDKNIIEKTRQLGRDHGGIGSSTSTSASLLAIGAEANQRRKRRRTKMVSIGGSQPRGYLRFGISPMFHREKQRAADKRISKDLCPIYRCKQHRMGRKAPRCWNCKGDMEGTPDIVAHKCQRVNGSSSCSRSIRKKNNGWKRCKIDHRFHGSLLLFTKRRGATSSVKSNRQKNYVKGDLPRHQNSCSRMDTVPPKPRRRAIAMGGQRRLEDLRSLFPLPSSKMETARKGDRGSLCRLVKFKVGSLQQSYLLPPFGGHRRILTGVGSGERSQLVGPSILSDPANPFVREGVQSKGNNCDPALGSSAMVASTSGNASFDTDHSYGSGLSGWSEREYRTAIEPVLDFTSLPDRWREMSPKEVRDWQGMDPDFVVEEQREYSFEELFRWANLHLLNDLVICIKQFIGHSREIGVSPDDKTKANKLVRSYFLRFGHKFTTHFIFLELLYAISKLWDFNPVSRFRKKSGLDGKDVGLPSPSEINLIQLIEVGRSKATEKVYKREWDGYYSFCLSNALSIKSHQSVGAYIVELWKLGQINKALAALNSIKKGSLLLGWEKNPADHDLIKEAKSSLNRLRSRLSTEVKRDPLPAQAIVSFIERVFKEGLEDEPHIIELCALILVGFRLMLRSKSLGALRKKDINFKEWGVEIAISPIKSSNWQRKHIEFNSDRRFCPADWLQRHMQGLNIRESDDLLFHGKNGRPLTSMNVTELVRKIARASGVEGDFSSHSLRIGGATAAALGGISLAQIQAVGGWESAAVLRYIRSIIGVSKNMSKRMGLSSSPSTSDNSVLKT